MKCFYNIKLPDGGVIKIPATYIPLKKDDPVLNGLIETYYNTQSNPDDILEARNNLMRYLKNSKVGVSGRTMGKLLNASDETDLIDNINKELSTKGDIEDLSKAIWRLSWRSNTKFSAVIGGKKVSLTTEEVLAELEKPIKVDYLGGLDYLGVLGTTSPKAIVANVKNLKRAAESIGLFAEIEESLEYMLRGIFKDSYTADLFYNLGFSGDSSDAIVTFSDKSGNPVIFHNGNDVLSIFLGVFKYMATFADYDLLKDMVDNFNGKRSIEKRLILEAAETDEEKKEAVRKFFTGTLDSSGFEDPEFDKIFGDRKSTTTLVNAIIELSTLGLQKANPNIPDSRVAGLAKSAKILFRNLDFVKYSKGIRRERDLNIGAYNTYREVNDELWIAHNSTKVYQYIKEKDYYYSPTNSKSFKSDSAETAIAKAYNYIKNNISLKKDLIKVQPAGMEYPMYIIPTIVNVRKDELFIQGFANIDGKPQAVFGTFSGDDITIDSRIFDDTTVNLNPVDHTKVPEASKIPTEDSVIIQNEDDKGNLHPIDPTLAKRLVTRGSTITYVSTNGKSYGGTVKAVYPGGVVLNNGKFLGKFTNWTMLKAEKIKVEDAEFTDAEEDKFTALSNYTKVKNDGKRYFYVEEGDIIEFQEKGTKRYNRVIKADEKSAYILIKTKKGYYITAISNNSATAVYKAKSETNLGERMTVAYFDNTINEGSSLRKTTSGLSYFTSYEDAENGDFTIYKSSVYKIVNKERGILVGLSIDNNTYALTDEYIKVNPNELHKFSTRRDISSRFAIDIAESNNIHLNTTKKTDEHIPAVYLIPENTTFSSGIVLDSGNMSFGITGAKSYYYNEDGSKSKNFPEGFQDITEKLAKKLSEIRGTKNEGLFLRSIDNYYKRHNISLYSANVKDVDARDIIKFLQPAAYIQIKGEKNRTYRIYKNTGKELFLEYNVFNSNGDFITVKKQVDIEEVAGNIEYLYLIKGNRKIGDLKKLVNSVKTDETTPEQERRSIVSEIAQRFSELFNINTEYNTEYKEEHKNDKAWIDATADGVKIVINLAHNNTDSTDFVHEYIHLFLLALKYNNFNSDAGSKNAYEELLLNFRNNNNITTDNFQVLEEKFVNAISGFMNEELSSIDVDYEAFTNAFMKSLENLGIDDAEIDETDNVFSILNMKMKDVFKNMKSSLMDEGLILFELNFRDWIESQIDSNQIKRNCN